MMTVDEFETLCVSRLTCRDCGGDMLAVPGDPCGCSCEEREDWPVHRPGPAWEAPIPGVHWYSGCDPDRPRVNPDTGRCEGCGEPACVVCGREACPDHGDAA